MPVVNAPSDDSVTQWAEQLRLGDPNACDRLHQRYARRLISIIRRRYSNALSPAADEYDLAQSAFCALWKAAANGTLRPIANRDSFLALLLEIAKNKAISRIRAARTLKRGGAHAHTPSSVDVEQLGILDNKRAVTQSLGHVVLEEQQLLFDYLADDILRTIALYKLEGFTHSEIAAKLGMGLRTVERKVATIRTMWITYAETSEGGLPDDDAEVH